MQQEIVQTSVELWYQNPGWWECGLLITGLVVALWQIYVGRDIEKKKAIVDRMFSGDFAPLHENAMPIINWYDENKNQTTNKSEIGELVTLKDGHCKQGSDVVDAEQYVRDLLNYYENLAVGIKLNIFCEETLRCAERTYVLELHRKTKCFIEAIRNDDVAKRDGKPSPYYIELDKLAESWIEKPNSHR